MSRPATRYRIEHHGEHRGASVINQHATLAAALVEVSIVRRWLAAAGTVGTLVVIDEGEIPERRIGTYPIVYAHR